MNVGKRIQKMRQAQDMTIDQLASAANLTAAQIKEIEKGESVPSIGTVLKLSRALGSKMGQILNDGAPKTDLFSIVTKEESVEVSRRSGERDLTGQGYSYKRLINPEIRGQGMEPFLVEFDPTSASTVKTISHQGEEFIFVLNGTLELEYDGEIHTLKKGDSLYMDSSKPHAVRGIGKTPPVAVAVVLGKE